uniref:CSON007374 protein n=1 Tax=Culicoides sonorensis TaxID=179676 RepID=A0A336JZV5_CULSO
MNPSLSYEVLMYLNSFYFGMFAACELGMGILKLINLPYPENVKFQEAILLVLLLFLETIRIIMGRKGSLSEHVWQVFVSVLLLLPCGSGVFYFLAIQEHILKLELILCALMFLLHLTELFFAFLFLFTMCRPPTYT